MGSFTVSKSCIKWCLDKIGNTTLKYLKKLLVHRSAWSTFFPPSLVAAQGWVNVSWLPYTDTYTQKDLISDLISHTHVYKTHTAYRHLVCELTVLETMLRIGLLHCCCCSCCSSCGGDDKVGSLLMMAGDGGRCSLLHTTRKKCSLYPKIFFFWTRRYTIV